MATSYTRYSGGSNTTSAIYTVPSGKIAKIIINRLNIASSVTIAIGDYDRRNQSGVALESKNGSGYPSSGVDPNTESEGILICRGSASNWSSGYMMIKNTHILVPSQTVAFQQSSSSNLIEFLVIQEDQ